MRPRPRRLVLAALVGTLAALTAWSGFQYTREIDRARTRVASGSRVITTPCGPIEFAEAGAGPAVLVIHGAGGGFDQGLALAGQLATRGHRVVAMSRFGYLRTPAPEHASVRLQADAHACLLNALGVNHAAVIGASAGAPSALEFALRYPDRCTALVLLVPGLNGLPDRQAPGVLTRLLFNAVLRSDLLFWAVGRVYPDALIRTALGTPPELVAAASHDDQERVKSMLVNIAPLSQRSAGLLLEAHLLSEPLSEPLSSISVPTLTLSARDDLYGTYASAQLVGSTVPQARFVGYATGGHLLVGHQDEVMDAIARFLEEHR